MRKARVRELRVISHYVGLMTVLLSALMLIPMATSLWQQEWAVAVDFLLSTGMGMTVGFGLMLLAPPGPKDLSWTLGMVTAALAWLVLMFVAAIPYMLSGHWLSLVDATFDVMSGFTTTGLVLVQDLDHIADGVNMWRHLISWLGGQGMVVLALTFFVRGLSGAFKMYVGEAKDERLMPNVVHTARAIWYISAMYLIVGTILQAAAGWAAGLSPERAFFHGLWIVMAGWSTGGFAPMSQNIVYYHSLFFEVVSVSFFILGSLNFNLHWAVWTGHRKEIYKNLEIVTFTITVTILLALLSVDLAGVEGYSSAIVIFRRGAYNLLSAHTGVGYASLYARQFILDYPALALTAMIAAMLFGGGASSTAGGFKAFRIGITFKAIVQDVKKLLSPESARLITKYHMGKENVLDDRLARTALSIILLYILLWAVLVIVPGFYAKQYGWDIGSLMFESASAVGNVGLSSGVTSVAMPDVVKIAYTIGMWLGRLEFFSVFVLGAWLLKGWRSK